MRLAGTLAELAVATPFEPDTLTVLPIWVPPVAHGTVPAAHRKNLAVPVGVGGVPEPPVPVIVIVSWIAPPTSTAADEGAVDTVAEQVGSEPRAKSLRVAVKLPEDRVWAL